VTVIKTESTDNDLDAGTELDVDNDNDNDNGDEVFEDDDFLPDLTNVEDLDEVPKPKRRGRRKRSNLVKTWMNQFGQGILTEGGGTVQLTSSLR
jgi:hypothetical protein